MGLFDGLVSRKRTSPSLAGMGGYGLPLPDTLPKWNNDTAEDDDPLSMDPNFGLLPSMPRPGMTPPFIPKSEQTALTMPPSPRLGELTKQRAEMDQPRSGKSRLWDAIIQAAPVALGALFGGQAGATGAGQGVLHEGDLMAARRDKRILTLDNAIQDERVLQERQYEAGLRKQTADNTAEGNRLWRQAQLTRDYDKMNQAAQTKLDSDDIKMLVQGYRRSPDGKGWVAVPENELSAAKQAYIGAQRAMQELRAAQTEAIPENIELKRRNLDIAMQRLTIAQEGMALRRKADARSDMAFERDTYGTVGGEPIPGFVNPATGESMGWKNPARPTSSTMTMGQMAGTVETHIPEINAQIDELDRKGQLGAIAGRWNEFWTGKAGFDNPQFNALRSNIMLMQSAIMRTHLGARGGITFLDKVAKMFSTKMAAANIKASFAEVASWMKTYRENAGLPPLLVMEEGGGPDLRKKGGGGRNPLAPDQTRPPSSPQGTGQGSTGQGSRAPIGTRVRVKGGGFKVKVSDTGDPNKDWKAE